MQSATETEYCVYFICRDANFDPFYLFASKSILPALPFTFPPSDPLILNTNKH